MTKLNLFVPFFFLLLLISCKENSTEPTDSEKPTVVISYPANGAEVKADTLYKIIADATDNKGITKVEFSIDGQNAASDSSSPYEYIWNTTGLSGDHTIMAKGYDAANNIGTSSVISVKIKGVANHAPASPSNPNPSNGATGVLFSLTLSWSCSDPDSDALTYDVYFDTSSNPTTAIATNQTTASISRNGLTTSTTYYWKIVAKDSKGAVTTGTVWSFTTVNHPPAVPSNPSPTDAATGVSTSPTLSWSCSDPDGDALTYDVFFGTNNPPTMQVDTGWSSNTLLRTGLSTNTTYYWKIVARDGKGAVTAGTVWSFITTHPPSVPSNPNPTDAATDVSTSPTLSWSCSDPDGDALTYDVYFGTSTNPTTAIATNQTTANISRSGLTTSTTYYWKIVAKDSKGAVTMGTVWSFTTTHPPAAPSNPNPADAATDVSTSPTLSWSCSDPDGDAVTYDVYFGTSTNPTTAIATNQSTTSISRSGLTNSTTYYWKIVAKDSKDAITTGPDWSFTTGSMVQVTGGTFFGRSGESALITISSFNIDKYEVTYEKWTDVRNWALTHGYTDLVSGQNGSSNQSGANNPVTMVNWYDIAKWCNARSEKNGLTPVYYTDNTQSTVYRTGNLDINVDAVKWNADGYRLPTAAEWEFAARGGTSSQGYTYSGSNTIDNVAWYNLNSGYTTHTVGTKSANELGIYDMSGNVFEWCWDWYDPAYSSGGTLDPKGTSTPQPYRELQGGTFDNDGSMCQVNFLNPFNHVPTLSAESIGFRCVQD
ncbi:MAG: SUMF1/EgtB/PvdO family nonheme iron enzyme [Bacteroidota bacterium]